MKCLIGLGNPGKKYEQTRHNVGFKVIDAFAKRHDMILTEEKKFRGEIGTVHINGEKVVLLKPLTYMNLSGESMAHVMNFYGLTHEDILVIYDDMDLALGKLRIRPTGRAAGHNGVKSIILHLAGETFDRIKVGIGKPAHGDVRHFVLSPFGQSEIEIITNAITKATEACELWLTEDITKVSHFISQP